MKSSQQESSLFVFTLLAFLTGSIVAAPPGPAFNYQGRLQQSGAPASGLYDFQFSLWDAAHGVNLVGATQAVSNVTISNGLFTAQLDFGPGPFNGNACWLEIDVRTNGSSPFTALSPRQALLPTPYSIMANTASNLLGTLPAAQLSGPLPPSALAGYSGPVNFTNLANKFVGTFAGDGGGLTNLAGGAIQSGTISSNALDAPTRAQLAVAGKSGSSLTNETLFYGTNSISPTWVYSAARNDSGDFMELWVTGTSDTNLRGKYSLFLSNYDVSLGWSWYVLTNGHYSATNNLGDYIHNGNPQITFSDPPNTHSDPNASLRWPNGLPLITDGFVWGASNAAISGIQISGPVRVGGQVQLDGQVTFAQPPVGSFSVDWNSGVSNKPAAYKVVPGQHRPLRAKIGVNTWYDCYTGVYGYCITNIANQFISWGLRDAGWVWIGIDDGWQAGRDTTTHWLVPDPGKYPQGMRALTDGIHSMGFKVGLYTSFPYCGAPGYPSTANYPVQDAQAMCDWNVDCLKFDGVGSASWMSTFYDTVQTLYLSNSRAPLYIETYCTPTDGFGVYQDPRLNYWATSQLASRDWPIDVGYFLSRFESELGAGHDYFSSFVPAAGLLICTNLAGVPPTNAYNAVKAQMSVLAMLSADMVANRFNPGYASNYLYTPPAAVLTAMKNTNVLAVHQDPAQVTGWPIIHDMNKVVWLKPLGSVDGPEWAVTIWNPSTTAWSTNTFGMTNLPGLFTGTWRAVELWSMTTQIVSTVITCTNVPYEPKMYRLTPTWMH